MSEALKEAGKVKWIITGAIVGLILGFLGGVFTHEIIFNNNRNAIVGNEYPGRAFDVGERTLEDIINRNRLNTARIERSEKLAGRLKDNNRDIERTIKKAVNDSELNYNRAASGINRIEEGVKVLTYAIDNLKEAVRNQQKGN
jgi:gas vesicle protein